MVIERVEASNGFCSGLGGALSLFCWLGTLQVLTEFHNDTVLRIDYHRYPFTEPILASFPLFPFEASNSLH